jgi:hypothetical protein
MKNPNEQIYGLGSAMVENANAARVEIGNGNYAAAARWVKRLDDAVLGAKLALRELDKTGQAAEFFPLLPIADEAKPATGGRVATQKPGK